MDGNVRFSQEHDSGNTAALPKTMEVAAQYACTGGARGPTQKLFECGAVAQGRRVDSMEVGKDMVAHR
jgi:hypothetical protein